MTPVDAWFIWCLFYTGPWAMHSNQYCLHERQACVIMANVFNSLPADRRRGSTARCDRRRDS